MKTHDKVKCCQSVLAENTVVHQIYGNVFPLTQSQTVHEPDGCANKYPGFTANVLQHRAAEIPASL